MKSLPVPPSMMSPSKSPVVERAGDVRAADQDVVAGLAVEDVVALLAEDDVVAGAGVDQVVAGAGRDVTCSWR